MSDHKRFGVIGVFGRANAGKSTLVNALVGERVSAVSAKPQTTRRRILGILTEGGNQVVFCDTPGFHPIRNKLDAFMDGEIRSTIAGLQGALFLIDALDYDPDEDARLLGEIAAKAQVPLYLVVNKIDLVDPKLLDGIVEVYGKLAGFAGNVRISAREGKGLEPLRQLVFSLLIAGEHAFAADDYTDQTEREIVEDVVREAILERYYHEIPHSVAVMVEEFKERDNGKTWVQVNIFLEKDSQKRILIGTGGKGIKELGVVARQRLNQQLGRDIFLELWVKVRRQWRRSEEWVRRMGYSKK